LYTKSKKRIFTYGDWGGGGLVLATNFVYAKLEGGDKTGWFAVGDKSKPKQAIELLSFSFIQCIALCKASILG